VDENGITPERVQRIEAELNENVLMHGGSIYEPQQVVEAQFSLRFTLALRLLTKRNDLRQYMNPEFWSDPQILALGRKIHLVSDPNAKGELRFACRMRVTLTDGNVLEGYLPSPKGTARNPLSPEEIRRKFFDLADGILPNERLHQIVDEVQRIDRQADVSALARMMVSPTPR
jgi:2-methylcitrate dehydratase PrpD